MRDWRDSGAGAILFALALGWFWLSARGTLDLRDEGYLIAQASKVAAGALPHLDFSDVYGPGVLLLTGAALKLGGGELLAVRLLVMLCKAASVLFGFALARQVAPRWAAVAAALLSIAYWGRVAPNLNTPYAAIFTIPLGLLACWLLVRALGTGRLGGVFVAGVVAGAGIGFKQSLAAMLFAGLGASIFAAGMLRAAAHPAAGATPARRAAPLLAWWGLAAIGVAPFATRLTASDYALHFAPLHALFGWVTAQAWHRGGVAWPGRVALREGGAFALGGALLPAAMLLFYGAAGALPALVDDMLVLPLSLRSYAQPAPLPPLVLALLVAGVVLGISAALLGEARRARAALVAAGTGLLCLAAGLLLPTELPRLREPAVLLGRGPFGLEGVLLPGLLLAALVLGRWRTRQRRPDSRASLEAWLGVLFCQAMLAFEVFPRAGHNLWLLHGALLPLLALVLADWSRLASAGTSAAPWRRAVAAAGVLALPVWAVTPVVREVVWPSAARQRPRPLAAPQLRGLAFGAGQIAAEHLDDAEELLAWLAIASPADAPLLTLSNEAMLPVLAGRPAFADEHRYGLFLAGWGMLPRARAAALDSGPLLERLSESEDVIVVLHNDPTYAHLRNALPNLTDFVATHFEPVARFGVYQVFRRDGFPTGR